MFGSCFIALADKNAFALTPFQAYLNRYLITDISDDSRMWASGQKTVGRQTLFEEHCMRGGAVKKLPTQELHCIVKVLMGSSEREQREKETRQTQYID